jgi:hypothetical protein
MIIKCLYRVFFTVILTLYSLWCGIEIWGCARGFGRGTLYMKWGQQNQRFGKMRLGGEKMKNEKKKKERENVINRKKRQILKYDYFIKYCKMIMLKL